MGSLGRRSGKLVSDSFRSCSWRIMPETQILRSNKRFSQFEHLLVPAWNGANFHIGISSHSLISQGLGLQGRANMNLFNPFLNEARRFYCVNQYNTARKHRKSRGLRWWFRVGVLIVICCSAVIVKIYYDHLEIVPYHHRTRLIVYSEPKLRSLSEMVFKIKKESLEGRILLDTQLESIRVRRIAQDLFDAYKVEIQRQGSELSTMLHLDGLDWEVLVVRGFGHDTSLVCGKIVLFDWMFEHITSDAEIAFLVAREMGHIIARHYAEDLTIHLSVSIMFPILKVLKPILNPIGLWEAAMDKYVSYVFYALHIQEVEADYIGMHLSALAGYDPRVAPKLLEKMDKFWTPNAAFPTPKKRARFLSFPGVMEKPVSIYLRGCLKSNRT
ncbi:hypothetical protein QN277_012096 [Acacia crassicarpa]|uniref:Peptidase M48 domain-containing protein n=1 Tax=Acacia crassicarpa TaxID=499986 RepID=A0AAE1TD18_9FABA|nr:hypothetical protein QN277_012096 [Acacia crassicarpa]